MLRLVYLLQCLMLVGLSWTWTQLGKPVAMLFVESWRLQII